MMELLAKQQTADDAIISSFRSDGCSGGMSSSWQQLALVSPTFARIAGNQPPWTHCCVAHDRSYWRGETDSGYQKRLQADNELRSCVNRWGIEKGDDWAKKLGVNQQEIIGITRLTAELMYTAVRLGGAPCTGLPWRWGHGWPECQISIETIVE